MKTTDILEFVQARSDREATFKQIFLHFTRENFRNHGKVVSGVIRLINSGHLKDNGNHHYIAPLNRLPTKIFTDLELQHFKTWLSKAIICLKCFKSHPLQSHVFESISLSTEEYYLKSGNPFRVKRFSQKCTKEGCRGCMKYTETKLINSYFGYIFF